MIDVLDALAVEVLDAAPDGIVVTDESGSIIFANSQIERLFGYSPGEIVGQPVESLVPQALRRPHATSRREYRAEPHRRPMGIGLDLVALRKDGSAFPVEISLAPLTHDGRKLVMASVRDVTDRRLIAEALNRSEEQYRLIAESAHDVVYWIAAEPGPRRVQYISPSIRATGHAPEAFYERMELLEEIVHPDDRDLFVSALSAPAADLKPLTIRHRLADGTWAWHEHRFVFVRKDDRSLAIEGIARDITERVRAEESRRLLLGDREMQRERERIAADLHDGVMQSIYGVGLGLRRLAGLVADDPELRAQMSEATDELSRAITDIRRYVMDLRPVGFTGDLAASLESVVPLFNASSGIDTKLTIEADVPALGEECGLALFHIARESLSNVRRHARPTHVTLTLKPSGGAVRLVVHDDGVGFTPTVAPLDEHFGLRNMEMRARSVGGRLSVESAPGHGTTVTVTVIPPAESEAAAQA